MDSSCSRTAELSGPPADAGGGGRRRSAARRLFSPASTAEHARVTRRLLWALPAALLLIALLIMIGPTAEEIERRFTIYGKEGPLRIMPEVVIEEGEDRRELRQRPQVTPPPGAPEYQVLPEDPLPQETTPPPRQADTATPRLDRAEESDLPVDQIAVGAGDGDAAVDMFMAAQFAETDYIIRKLVRPIYPLQASAADRQRPLIVVEAAFYLDEEANIVTVLVQSNEGGPEFADAVRLAMQQWEFEPRWRDGRPPAPRWLVVTWRFRNPAGGRPFD